MEIRRDAVRMAGIALSCLSILIFPIAIASAGDVTSTRLSGQPFDWTEISMWSHDPAVSTFPNNGNEGHTFDVIFPTSLLATLSQSIKVDNLDLWGTLQTNGNPFIVEDLLKVVIGTIDGGTVSATNTLVTSTNLSLTNCNFLTESITLNNNADVFLSGTSTCIVNGFINFTGDGDLTAADSVPSFSMNGALITKTGGSSVSDITARLTSNDLTIKNESQFNSVIRFNQYTQSWSNLDIICNDFKTIDFSVPLTLDTVTIDNDGEVFFKGTTMLSGMLTATSPGSGAVKLSTFIGEGSISGGTLNCAINTPFVIEGFAGVGPFGMVTNVGSLQWKDGLIVGGGLRNEGDAFTIGTGVREVLMGTLTNVGNFSHNDPITLSIDGIVENQGTWFLDGNMASQGAPVGDDRRFETSGTIEVLGNSSIGVPVDASGILNLNSSTMTITEATNLHDLTVNGDLGGKLILSPDTSDPKAEFVMSGVIEVNGDGLIDVQVFQIAGGDHTLNGEIRGGNGMNGASVYLKNNASLSGGTLNVDANEDGAFVQTGDSILAKTAPVANTGDYHLGAGTIESPGLTNSGSMRIFFANGNRTIRKLVNIGEVKQIADVLMAAPGIANEGVWDIAGTSINFLDGIPGSVFSNTGLFESNATATANVDVTFDNLGTVSANNADINFTHDVLQWDPVAKELTGGEWIVCGAGKINILDEIIIKRIGPASRVSLKATLPDGLIEFWGGIEEIAGLLSIASHAQLDASDNEDEGDIAVDEEGIFSSEEAILGPAGNPARFIANRITNRGQVNATNGAVVQANVAIDLLDAGRLTGNLGIFETPIVSNISGNVEPGTFNEVPGPVDTTGQLTIDGNYDQQPAGMLTIELAGTTLGDFDTLTISGAATLDGALVINAINGYEAQPNDTFEILTAATVSGTFATISAPAAVDVSYFSDRVVINFAGAMCEGDFDMSGGVDSSDLLGLLAAWGTCPGCVEDINNDGNVDLTDLLALLAGWGTCE